MVHGGQVTAAHHEAIAVVDGVVLYGRALILEEGRAPVIFEAHTRDQRRCAWAIVDALFAWQPDDAAVEVGRIRHVVYLRVPEHGGAARCILEGVTGKAKRRVTDGRVA